jgi:hypothetical protein
MDTNQTTTDYADNTDVIGLWWQACRLRKWKIAAGTAASTEKPFNHGLRGFSTE